MAGLFLYSDHAQATDFTHPIVNLIDRPVLLELRFTRGQRDRLHCGFGPTIRRKSLCSCQRRAELYPSRKNNHTSGSCLQACPLQSGIIFCAFARGRIVSRAAVPNAIKDVMEAPSSSLSSRQLGEAISLQKMR